MQVVSESISGVLSKNSSSFFIPPFQRAYSWGKQEIDRYFDDLVRIIESKRNDSETDKLEHFFGVLVLKDEKVGLAHRTVVVDGQQRLTTTLLLLIALRDWTDSEDIQADLENMYLKNPTSSFSDKIKLKQVTQDWDAYRALINGGESIPGKITDGYDLFIQKLKQENFGELEYVEALSCMNVACISLDNRPYKGEDPQIIFETLNSLGKPLTFADLIRNYILLGLDADKQTKIYETIWHPKIENVLHERTSYFFRDIMQYKQSKYFKVVSENNTKELYALFTQFVDKLYGGDKTAFVTDVSRYVELYRWIDVTEPVALISQNTEKNRIIAELLRNIFHDIKAEAFKPIVLGLLEYHQYGFDNNKMNDEQLTNALSVIRTYLIRRRVLKLTQGENKEIPTLCDSIKKNHERWLTKAKEEMLILLSGNMYALRTPNDVEITDRLKNANFYKGLSKYNKFILGKIEETRSKVSVDFRDKKITIEHIMPQRIERSKPWKKEIGDNWNEVHNEYVHNIGNLILTEFNEIMGNKPLADKKRKLFESNLQYRLDVINNATWCESDILKHQAEMIERFLETFSLPLTMQQENNWNEAKSSSNLDIISPLDDECPEIVRGRKPNAVLINDELHEVREWQDVYLEFLRWLLANKPFVFGDLLKKNPSAKYPLIASKSDILILAKEESNTDIKGRYKRLSDGVLLSSARGETEENPLYVFINRDSKFFIIRMKEAMLSSEMDEESVTIELKPIKSKPL